jgi:hypothetical protein
VYASFHNPSLLLLAWLSFAAGLSAGCTQTDHAPALAFVANAEVSIGEELVIELFAWDADSTSLNFNVTSNTAIGNHSLTSSGSTGTFRWAPAITLLKDTPSLSKTFNLTFTVQDDTGLTDAQTIAVHVTYDGSTPAFLTPPGHVVNLAVESHAAFLVEVRDDDDVTVILTLAQGIPGANFQQLDGKTASFYWKPTPAQIAESSYWSITIHANDGDHETVVHPMTLVLIHDDVEVCPGTQPTIAHVALPDQTLPPPWSVLANIADLETTLEEVTLHWRTAQQKEGGYETVPMALQSNGTWAALMGPPGLPSNATEVLFYHITARDNDDLTGSNCDHETQSPKAGDHVFVAYGQNLSATCLDDGYEPNDNAPGALLISEGTYPTLRNCGDPDWFRVPLPQGGSLTATLTHESAHGQLGLSLHLFDGNTLKQATTGNIQTLAYGPVNAPQDLLVRVQPASSTASQSYTLSIQPGVGGCTNDPYEPNDSLVNATQIPSGSHDDLRICPGDSDWFAFPMLQGQHFQATAHFQHNDGDLDMSLRGPDGITSVALAISETSNEELSWIAETSGTHYLEISGFSNATNNYDLDVLVLNANEVCVEDIVHPNHVPAAAKLLPAGSWTGLVLCPGTADYFRYDLNGSETLTAQAISTDPQISIQMRILDPASGAPIGGNGASAGGAWAEAVASSQGSLVMEVSQETFGEAAYSLAFAAENPPGICVVDRFEPNNLAAAATPLNESITTRMTICGLEEDWFSVELGTYDILEVWAVFRHDQGDIDVSVFGPDGSQLGASTSKSDDEELSVLAPALGVYTIRVRGNGPIDNAYDLVVSTQQ